MPVKNKALSEYKKKFRWHESVKSSSFKPSPEQKSPTAGLSSADFGQQEPPLQHKRYPLPPNQKVTYTTQQFYGDVTGSDDEIGKRKGLVIGGGKGTGIIPMTPLKTYKIGGSREGSSRSPKAPQTKPSKNKEPIKNKTYTAASLKSANSHATSAIKGPADSAETNVNNNKDVSSPGKRDTRENAVHTSKPAHKHTTKPNVALQYQAGIKDTRPKSAKYLSEYQRNYEWRNALPKESPLMAAEQMVYKSQANINPFVPDKIPRRSEYKLQFRDWSPVRRRSSTAHQQLMENAEREIKAKYRVKTKSKKSKRSSLTPDKMRPAGVPSMYAHDDLKLLKSAQNPAKPFFPHSTTIRKWKSEYASNFKEPDIYRYENGIWKGADPPHITPKDDSSVDRRNAQPNWFAEVLELRQKADDYRKRARGTHFSREHLAQILASQARLWDESSTATSTVSSLSAPSVDTGLKDRNKDNQEAPISKPAPVSKPADSPPVNRRLAWPQSNNDEVKNGAPQPLDDGDHESSIGSIPTPEGYRGSATPSSDEVETIDEQGRLPTPRLREEGLSKRHHLDRTTPATGGAVLTSPQPKHRSASPPRTAPVTNNTQPAPVQISQGHRRNIIPGAITQGFAYDSDEDSEDEQSVTPRVTTPPPKPDMKTRILNQLSGSPTAGVTTRDPDPIRESLAQLPHFQRHSNNYFETSPALPVMPRKIEPPRTWAAAPRHQGEAQGQSSRLKGRSGEEGGKTVASGTQTLLNGNRQGPTQAPGVRGPLDRPNSGSMHGRPMTAHPQTREEAESSSYNKGTMRSLNDHQGDNPSTQAPKKRSEAWMVPADPPQGRAEPDSPLWRSSERDSDELSLSTMSIASSCSLASEVLERARKRRDDFWGK
ncbi:nuclear protein MDM1-like [Acanthaster planci]|uniref:Nuclear protein MDM1 n=1 Tax=Acanthaster planci TaxID=133434 RepID=A0A8B7Z688_ACAPL|nr:nuclear protein MDM1-like [Acanthaster planci]